MARQQMQKHYECNDACCSIQSKVTIRASGEDEEDAVNAIAALF